MNVLFFRYGESFPVSAEVLDSSFCLPIGKAKVSTLKSTKVYLSMFMQLVTLLLCLFFFQHVSDHLLSFNRSREKGRM